MTQNEEIKQVKAALYLRVSSEHQEVENQYYGLDALARRLGAEVVEVFQEEEPAWRAGHQRELARLLRMAKIGRFDAVLVWSLDRLSRQGSLAILSLVHKLGRYGVRVISCQEPWTEAPGELAEILYSIAGWVARMESQRISERTKAGLVRATEKGHYPGRPKGALDKKRRKKRSVKVPTWADLDLYPVGRG